jgi:hypothetical protein
MAKVTLIRSIGLEEAMKLQTGKLITPLAKYEGVHFFPVDERNCASDMFIMGWGEPRTTVVVEVEEERCIPTYGEYAEHCEDEIMLESYSIKDVVRVLSERDVTYFSYYRMTAWHDSDFGWYKDERKQYVALYNAVWLNTFACEVISIRFLASIPGYSLFNVEMLLTVGDKQTVFNMEWIKFNGNTFPNPDSLHEMWTATGIPTEVFEEDLWLCKTDEVWHAIRAEHFPTNDEGLKTGHPSMLKTLKQLRYLVKKNHKEEYLKKARK